MTLPEAEHWRLLQLVADGLTNEQIATRWAMPAETVKWRVKALNRRLGAKCRANAVSIGYQRGILPYRGQP